MPSVSEFAAAAVDRSLDVLPLAAVPFVVTLLDVERLRVLLPTDDRVFSVTFGFPRDVTTLWSFLNVTADGVSVGPVGGEFTAEFLAATVVVVVVASSLLAAGYLGSIDASLRGNYDFLREVREHARPFLGFGFLEAGVGLLVVAVGLFARPLLLPAVVSGLVLAYLFFATPYLVVTEGRGLADALGRCFDLSTSDGRYLGFFVAYVLVSAALSVPVSYAAFNFGSVGIAAALLVVAPLALVLNVATLLFVRSLGEPSADAGQSNIPVDI